MPTAYSGLPVCVFSESKERLLLAAIWFETTFDLVPHSTSDSDATNFVLIPEPDWSDKVAWGNEDFPDDAEDWLSRHLRRSGTLQDGYIFINLDEELGDD